MRVLKFEIFKMIHKKEIFIFLFFIIGCSALFASLLGSDSDIMIISGLERMGGMFFSVFVYNFVSELFLIQIIIAVTVAGIWASELNNGTIAYVLTMAKSRKQIFLIKSGLSVTYSILYIALLFTSCWLFYLLIGRNGKYYTDNFMSLIEGRLGSYFIIILLMIVFTCSLVTLISMLESQMKALFYYMILLILMRILEQVKAIKEFIPSYLFSGNHVYAGDWDSSKLLRSIIIIFIWSGVFYAISYIIFKKKNIN